MFLVNGVNLVSAFRPNFVILVAVVQAHVVGRGGVESRARGAVVVEGSAGTAEGVIETAVRRMRSGRGTVRRDRRRRRIETLGVTAVRVSVEAASDEGVGRHVALADEGVALEDFDSGRSSEDRGEERRMIGTRCPRERRVEGQKSRGRRVAAGAFYVTHRGAVVQRLDRKESRDFLPMLVDVLEQETIAPHAQPTVDATCADCPLLGIELAQGFLHPQQALLARVGHRATQIEDPAATVRGRAVLIRAPHFSQTFFFSPFFSTIY